MSIEGTSGYLIQGGKPSTFSSYQPDGDFIYVELAGMMQPGFTRSLLSNFTSVFEKGGFYLFE